MASSEQSLAEILAYDSPHKFEPPSNDDSLMDYLTQNPLTGDRREHTPASVKAVEAVDDLAPVIGTAYTARDIQEEIEKEDTNWWKVGAYVAGEVVGHAPLAGTYAKQLIRSATKGSNKLKNGYVPAEEEVITDLNEAYGDPPSFGGGKPANPYTSDADVLTDLPQKNANEILNIDEAEKAAWQSQNSVNQKKTPTNVTMDNAKGLLSREITQEEFQEVVESALPIKPFTEVPPPPSLEEMVYALNTNKVDKGIIGVNKFIENGTPVGIRLDIPSYDTYDTWIVSVHSGTNKKSIGYNQTAVIENVSFTSSPVAAIKIATGEKSKQPFARMHGSWVNEDPQDVYERAQALMDDPEWVQVGMNPYRHSYFYDKATGDPLVHADELIQVGALVLAKNVKRASRTDPKFNISNKDPESRAFNAGGFVTPLH